MNELVNRSISYNHSKIVRGGAIGNSKDQLLTFSLDAERGGRQMGEKKLGPLHLVL